MSHAHTRAVHALLTQRFPQAFPRCSRDIRPLKIGITEDLVAALGHEADPALLRRAVANHTRRDGYALAILQGQERIDLQGHPVGIPTEADRALAAQRLEASRAREKARNARRQAHETRGALKRTLRAEALRPHEQKTRRRAEHLTREQVAQERTRQRIEREASNTGRREVPITYKRRRRVLSLEGEHRRGASADLPTGHNDPVA